jgi:hypothetical protein
MEGLIIFIIKFSFFFVWGSGKFQSWHFFFWFNLLFERKNGSGTTARFVLFD